MARCLLGLGANLGDPQRQFAAAVQRLASHPRIELLKVSRFFASQPIGGPAGQPAFLNAAALLETRLSPHELLAEMQLIETSLGRRRTQAWEARSIDIDVLLYGDAIVHEAGLRIPHPWMVARHFVLQPAAEIANKMRHPLTGWTIARLLEHLEAAAPRFALVGCPDDAVVETIVARVGLAWISDPSRRGVAERLPRSAAPASVGAPAVPSLEQQLEFLRQRSDQLQDSPWNSSRLSRPVLCDFWLDESLVEARATLPPDDWRRYQAEFQQVAERIAPPKLVMLVRAPTSPDREVSVSSDVWLAALRQRVITCGVSPYVEVACPSYDDLIREVAGAVVAMECGP